MNFVENKAVSFSYNEKIKTFLRTFIDQMYNNILSLVFILKLQYNIFNKINNNNNTVIIM